MKGREKSIYCHRGSLVAMRIPARNDARARETVFWDSLVCVLLRGRHLLDVGVGLCFRIKVAHVSPHCSLCNISLCHIVYG